MNPTVSIALLSVAAPEVLDTSLQLNIGISSASLLVDSNISTELASTAILSVLKKVNSDALIFKSYEAYLEPIMSKVSLYFTRTIGFPFHDLAFLNTELPVIDLLKRLEDITSTATALPSIDLHKSITQDVLKTTESTKLLPYRDLGKEHLATVANNSISTSLGGKESIGLTIDKIGTYPHLSIINPPHFTDITTIPLKPYHDILQKLVSGGSNERDASVAQLSDIFEYIRAKELTDYLDAIESADIPRLPNRGDPLSTITKLGDKLSTYPHLSFISPLNEASNDRAASVVEFLETFLYIRVPSYEEIFSAIESADIARAPGGHLSTITELGDKLSTYPHLSILNIQEYLTRSVQPLHPYNDIIFRQEGTSSKSDRDSSVAQLSDIFEYIRAKELTDYLDAIESADIARAPGGPLADILEFGDKLGTTQGISFIHLVSTFNRNTAAVGTRAERRETNWGGVGPKFLINPSFKPLITLDDIAFVARVTFPADKVNTQNIASKELNIKFIEENRFNNFYSNGTINWYSDQSTKDRRESRVDLRAERREANWGGVGPQFLINPSFKPLVTLEELAFVAKAFAATDKVNTQNIASKELNIKFTEENRFSSFYSNGTLNWYSDQGTKDRRESRVDLRAERREVNWGGVGPKFLINPSFKPLVTLEELAFVVRAVIPIEKVITQNIASKELNIKFIEENRFNNFYSDGNIRWYSDQSTKDRRESRVDLRAERREANWGGVGPQFLINSTFKPLVTLDDLAFVKRVVLRQELVDIQNIASKELNIKFTEENRFNSFYSNGTILWEQDLNTKDRRESRVDLRADRKEGNWGGVGIKFSIPIRFPEQSIDIEELALVVKAFSPTDRVNIQNTAAKEFNIKFIEPNLLVDNTIERREASVYLNLINKLLINKLFKEVTYLLSDTSVVRVPQFLQPIVSSLTQNAYYLHSWKEEAPIAVKESYKSLTYKTLEEQLVQLSSLADARKIVESHSIGTTLDYYKLLLLKRLTTTIKVGSTNYLNFYKSASDTANFSSQADARKIVESYSTSVLAESHANLFFGNYKALIEAKDNFYREVNYNRNPTGIVEVDATISGFAQDYSPAYFSQAYVGTAFLGE